MYTKFTEIFKIPTLQFLFLDRHLIFIRANICTYFRLSDYIAPFHLHCYIRSTRNMQVNPPHASAGLACFIYSNIRYYQFIYDPDNSFCTHKEKMFWWCHKLHWRSQIYFAIFTIMSHIQLENT